ncbi:fumarylacetoacetate hydrolase family protein [bacterium]|nr:fumarylacetoacetate hydrolase family protein [bacterium]
MSTQLVKNIWAVGRNYQAHAAEMKAEVPKEPFFFLKSGSCLEHNSKITLPTWSNDVHHEIEIALWIDENLNFSHISLALDLTARDAQNLAKSKGLPWTLAKSFKGSCPIGQWISLQDVQSIESLSLELVKNKQMAQKGQASDMIFKPQQLLEYVKKHYPLQPHDVILTGTPEGVASLKSGDLLQARLQSGNREILACHWDVV